MHATTEKSTRLETKVYLVHNGEIIAEVNVPEGLKAKELSHILNDKTWVGD